MKVIILFRPSLYKSPFTGGIFVSGSVPASHSLWLDVLPASDFMPNQSLAASVAKSLRV